MSSLVILASYEDKEKPEFADVLKKQIDILREQLDKSVTGYQSAGAAKRPRQIISHELHRLVEPMPQPTAQPHGKVLTTWDPRRDYRAIFDRIAQRATSDLVVPGGWGQLDPASEHSELSAFRK